MAYITREDGTHFVIPSYRDILSAKKPSLLKKEILLLSANYGEYITLQRKNADQYEVAFSTEPGYLLGETVWSYFNKSSDLIYCEAIQGTNEAILVIVKSGSVYLDGSFPIDSIPDELVVFQTQQSRFEIYLYGDLPISQEPAEGKFALSPASVKSFKILENPLFPVLPTVKAYQLTLATSALTAQGIGIFPVKQLVVALGAVGAIGLLWLFISTRPAVVPTVVAPIVSVVQFVDEYSNMLRSPAPDVEMQKVINNIRHIFSAPGWVPTVVNYSNGDLEADLESKGTRIKPLAEWAKQNNVDIQIKPEGIHVAMAISISNRDMVIERMPLQDVLIKFIDRESYVEHGHTISLGPIDSSHDNFKMQTLTLTVNNVSFDTLELVVDQFKDLPLILTKANFTFGNDSLSGTMTLAVLGS